MLKCLRQQRVDSIMLQSLSASNWKLQFLYEDKVENFLALLYKLYFICVLGNVKCSFAKPPIHPKYT